MCCCRSRRSRRGVYVANRTPWTLCISLNQVGPLYFQNVVKPGEVFHRKTGVVWFTIKAYINPNGQQLITDAKCALPILAIVGAVIGSAVTGGVAACAPAGTSVFASALATVVTRTALLPIAGAVIGGCAGAVTGVSAALADSIKKNASACKTGCYANGSCWVVTGGHIHGSVDGSDTLTGHMEEMKIEKSDETSDEFKTD